MLKKNPQVLIVDDDKNILEILPAQIEELGFPCFTAENGREGLEKLRAGDMDIVLIDIKMPELNGIELLQAIKDEKIQVLSIILTAHGNTDTSLEAIKLGAFDFLNKPCQFVTLQMTIRRAVKYLHALEEVQSKNLLLEQWEGSFNSWPDSIVILDDSFNIKQYNRKFFTAINKTDNDINGHNLHKSLCSNDHRLEDCPLINMLEASATESILQSYSLWDGNYDVVAVKLTNKNGRPLGWMQTFRDVTELSRAEQEIKQAYKETDRIISSITAILIILDKNKNITRWNKAAEIAFGFKINDVEGKPLSQCDILWDKDLIKKQIERFMREKTGGRLEDITYQTPEGNSAILGLTLHLISTEKGKTSGILILGNDITKRKDLEIQLTHAQKLESIGQLAAGIAHEINTPTQYVGDNTRFTQDSYSEIFELIQKYGDFFTSVKEEKVSQELIDELEAVIKETDVDYLKEEIPKAITQTLDGVERIATIVRSMKEFSHPGSDVKVLFDINKAINSTITVARNEWKYAADMVTEFDPNFPMVSCLPGDFNQVILNLVINAAHAIEEKMGKDSDEKGTITVKTACVDEWAQILISDTGCGISKDIQNRIFDPFFTTKQVGKGTGQGLSIARTIIKEKHGGTLTVNSIEGQGTEFVIRLPLNTVSEINEEKSL